MTPEQLVNDIYDAIKSRLPQPILAKLTFKTPSPFAKKGVNICRGRILPQRTKSIFNADWCFYEVGVGRYNTGGAGGIGFVSFPENKKCGEGVYTATVTDLISRYAAARPKFQASKRGEPAQCVFTYYTSMTPPEQPASDLTELICGTFPTLEQLTVAK